MHKHEKNTSTERKKRTRTESKKLNKQRAQQRAAEKKANELSWEDLRGIHRECLGMLAIPGKVAPYLRSGDIMAKVKSKAEVRRIADILLKDVNEYKDSLEKIGQQWENRTGAADGPDEFLLAINIGEQYEQWSTSYNSVVLPNILALMDMFNEVLPENERITP